MYEELVKRLRYDAELLSQDGWAAGLFTEAADAIEELLKVAKAMHTWIFLNSVDEQKVYEECGLTDEINFALGYGGKVVVKPEEDEAKKPYDLLYEEGGLGIR
jgi:hypothetical protein